jgi:SAM-dependent methyltransferase
VTEQRLTFDRVAEQYDAARPSYPPAAFAHLKDVAGLEAGSRVLEVGCGTGLSTRGLAELGVSITAIDPGEAMVAVARRNLSGVADFQVTGFEGFEADDQSFAAIVSCQAWHWIPEEISYPTAARLLKPGGVLAVMGNVLGAPPPAVMDRFEPVYAQYAPALWGGIGDDAYRPQGPFAGLFAASGCFEPARYKGWTWRETQSADAFIARIGTISAYLMLETEVREGLFRELKAVIDAAGGTVSFEHETHMHWAVRRGTEKVGQA